MAAILFPESIIGTTYGAGYKLYAYDTGTTSDLTVYTDSALSAAHTQPIVADSDGVFAAIYIDSTDTTPKFVLHTDADVEVWTLDPFPISDVTTLTSDLDTAEADIDTLEGEAAGFDASIATLSSESSDYESRISTLESEVAELSGAAAPLTAVAACFFVGQTNPSFAQNSGFSGVSKSSDGKFDLTFSTARANANYIVVPGLGPTSTAAPLDSVITNRSTTGFRVETWYTTGGSTRSYQDRDVSLVVYDLDA